VTGLDGKARLVGSHARDGADFANDPSVDLFCVPCEQIAGLPQNRRFRIEGHGSPGALCDGRRLCRKRDVFWRGHADPPKRMAGCRLNHVANASASRPPAIEKDPSGPRVCIDEAHASSVLRPLVVMIGNLPGGNIAVPGSPPKSTGTKPFDPAFRSIRLSALDCNNVPVKGLYRIEFVGQGRRYAGGGLDRGCRRRKSSEPGP
jgi:hypothetical protein